MVWGYVVLVLSFFPSFFNVHAFILTSLFEGGGGEGTPGSDLFI